MNFPLVLACLAMLIGPVLFLLAKTRPAQRIIDGFVFVSISGLLLFHFFVDFEGESGWWSLLFLMLGFFGPLFLERLFFSLQKQVHLLTMLAGAIGFLVHEALDGAALVEANLEGEPLLSSLSAAIIVHRIPVGLTLWWLIAPRFGNVWALLMLIVSILTTILGYSLASQFFMHSIHDTFLWLQAFVAGSILHVVIFRFHLHNFSSKEGDCDENHQADESGFAFATPQKLIAISYEGIGNFIGALLLVIFLMLPGKVSNIEHKVNEQYHSHHHHHHDDDHVHDHHVNQGLETTQENIPIDSSLIVNTFMMLALESAPALLLAYLLGILIYGFFPEGSVRWLSKGGRPMQAARGMIVGLPLPLCSCGVLPYYQTLIKKGVPPAAGLAFLVATPEIGIGALFVSFSLMGFQLTIIRVIAAAIIAFIVALLVSPLIKQARSLPIINENISSRQDKFNKGMRFSLVELVDTTAPWMFVGLVLAAFAAPLLSTMNWSVSPILEVIIFSMLGLIVYVCASGATPLIAALIASGISPGAGIAFLITGPATNITTFGILSNLHSKRVALRFGFLIMVAAITFGIFTNLLFPALTLPVGELGHHNHSDHYGLLNVIALYGIGILFALSILRQGARGFFGHVLGH